MELVKNRHLRHSFPAAQREASGMDDPRRSWETLLEVTPPASPFGSRRRGFAFQQGNLGLELADARGEVPDEVLPAVAAHAGAQDFPAPSSKLHIMVPCSRPPEATFATADADVAPSHVDDLHGGRAVGARMKRHLPFSESALATPATSPATATPKRNHMHRLVSTSAPLHQKSVRRDVATKTPRLKPVPKTAGALMLTTTPSISRLLAQ